MNYSQIKEFLFNRVAYFSRKNHNYVLHLELMRLWLEQLGNPHLTLKSIHIAGTNGKGSVTTMLSEILIAQGYKVGTYMSPHVYDLRERIKVNGQFIEQEFVVNFVNSQLHFITKYRPSFFEIMTTMAWVYFHKQGVDIACIEVGLGGRLDATNLIAPVLSIVTNVSLDHIDYLGETIANIAQEKLAIIRPKIPLLIGRKAPSWQEIAINLAKTQKSPLYFASDYFIVEQAKKYQDKQTIWVRNLINNTVTSYDLQLMGNYQQENLLTVLQAIKILQSSISISDSAIKQGLKKAFLPARWQQWSALPKIITDAAHNEQAIQLLAAQLHEEALNPNDLHILLALTKEKNPQKLCQYLPAQAQYYATSFAMPRAMSATSLANTLQSMGLAVQAIPNPQDAYKLIRSQLKTQDTLIITGSFFLIASLEDLLKK